jgi:hypothetical protein
MHYNCIYTPLTLSIYTHTHTRLSQLHLTFTTLESVETTVAVYPLAAGLHRLHGVFIVDASSNKQYHNESLCEVLVADRLDNESDEDGYN